VGGDPNRDYYDAAIVNGNVIVKVTDGEHYTVNGNPYQASDPAGTGPRQPVIGEVVINEVLPAPRRKYSDEFVELYNTTGESLTIGGMFVDDIAGGGGTPMEIPGGTTIPPNGYYVNCKNQIIGMDFLSKFL
jgi:hypothetical protein